MISVKTSNIFDSTAEALVNPVNCVGISGAGLALEFKIRYPDNYQAYRTVCSLELLTLGKVYNFRTNTGLFIMNFPTKFHWRDRSFLQNIDLGLDALIAEIEFNKIKSIAIPALGCSLGQLSWKDVKNLIFKKFENCTKLNSSDLDVELYAPKI